MMGLLDLLANLGPDSLAEKRKQAMQAKLDAAGNAASGLLAPTTGTWTEGLTRALPITGEAWTANDAGSAIQEGQYGKAAAMGLLGLLPLGGMMAAGLRAGASVPKRMGQSGAIAWHGSPHKFDKFSLDKIGTGEGAQAYGHGLYLAESPEVAKQYQVLTADVPFNIDGVPFRAKNYNGDMADELFKYDLMDRGKFSDMEARIIDVVSGGKSTIASMRAKNSANKSVMNALDSVEKRVTFNTPQMYKTDIPDEAVARFLDWDKPLSQDSPQAFKDAFNKLHETYPSLKEQFFQAFRDKRPGNHYYSLLNDYAKTGDLVKNQTFATDAMREAGIPGIRYLDGGSRGAGQGSSNFVAFDPELIRILERNGIPTGNQPWKAGEWQGLLGGIGK